MAFAEAQQWALRAVDSDTKGSLQEAIQYYNNAVSCLEAAATGRLPDAKRSEVLRLIASYRDRTNQLTTVVSSRSFLSAGCTDAATEALIRSMLEEDIRQATKQRELEEKQSLELAARLAAEDAAAIAPPSAAPTSSLPAGSALTPTRRAPPPPSQTPGPGTGLGKVPGKGPGKGPGMGPRKRSLEAFCTTAPSNPETYVEKIVLRVGDQVYRGSFSIPTSVLQQYLKTRGTQIKQEQGADDGDDSDEYVATSSPGGKPFNPKPGNSHSQAPPSATSLADEMARVSVGPQGQIAGAKEDFHRDTAVQRPDSKDSGKPLEISREALRVNPPSDQRLYPLEGYETEAFIDPRRTINVPLPKATAVRELPPSATHTAVLFETAAVAAKLRNVHRMGGERAKEVDHFVASVETPVLNVKIPDVAVFVVEEACAGAAPIAVQDAMAGPFEIHVQNSLLAGEGLSEDVLGCARAFWRMLREICARVLLLPAEMLRLYYMATIRADACVCKQSKQDNLIYINLMVFQQQCTHDPASLRITGGKRPWQYWVQRLAMATAPPNSAVGLYDPTVRARFRNMMAAFGL